VITLYGGGVLKWPQKESFTMEAPRRGVVK